MSLPARARSFVGDDKVIAVGNDGAGDVGRIFASVPDDVGVGDVASSGGVNRHHVEGGEAAGHVEVFPVVNRRGHVLLGGAINDPVLLAGVGIIGGDTFAAGENQLIAARNGADDGGAIAARFVRAGCFPNGFSRLAI